MQTALTQRNLAGKYVSQKPVSRICFGSFQTCNLPAGKGKG